MQLYLILYMPMNGPGESAYGMLLWDFGDQTYLTIYSDQGICMRVELLFEGDHYALKAGPGLLSDVVGNLTCTG